MGVCSRYGEKKMKSDVMRVGWEEKKGVGEDESEEGQVSLHQSRENFPWKMEVPLVGG